MGHVTRFEDFGGKGPAAALPCNISWHRNHMILDDRFVDNLFSMIIIL